MVQRVRSRKRAEIDLHPTPTPNTVALWVRVSTSEQSVEAQRRQLKAEARKRKLRIVREFELEGYSAWKGEHADRLEEALAAAEAGEFSHFLMFSLDRLDRRGVAETISSLDRMWKAGVEVISLQESWLADPNMRDVFAAFAAWVARFQSNNRSEHVKSGLGRLRAEKKVAGPLPWAYRRIEDDGKNGYATDEEGRILPNDERIPTVSLVFDLYVNRRLGMDRVIDELKTRAISSPGGRPDWSRSAIQTLLAERSYAYGVHEKYGTPTVPFIHPGLWDRAQTIRKKNPHFKPAMLIRVWPFQGAICAYCGSPYGVDSGGGRRRDYFCRGRYKGSPYHKRTGEVCRAVGRLKADVVEPAALQEIISTFADPLAMIIALDARIDEIKDREMELSRDLAPIEERLEKINRALSRMAMAWVDEVVDDAELEVKRRELESERDTLLRRREALGPDRLAELEHTRNQLQGAFELREISESRARQGVPMKQFSSHPEHAFSPELSELRKSDGLRLDMPETESVPEVLADWLHRLHAEVSIHPDPDRIEIRGYISADVLIDDQTIRQTASVGRGLG